MVHHEGVINCGMYSAEWKAEDKGLGGVLKAGGWRRMCEKSLRTQGGKIKDTRQTNV